MLCHIITVCNGFTVSHTHTHVTEFRFAAKNEYGNEEAIERINFQNKSIFLPFLWNTYIFFSSNAFSSIYKVPLRTFWSTNIHVHLEYIWHAMQWILCNIIFAYRMHFFSSRAVATTLHRKYYLCYIAMLCCIFIRVLHILICLNGCKASSDSNIIHLHPLLWYDMRYSDVFSYFAYAYFFHHFCAIKIFICASNWWDFAQECSFWIYGFISIISVQSQLQYVNLMVSCSSAKCKIDEGLLNG